MGFLGRNDADTGISAFFHLSGIALGVPLGIWTANSDRCNKIMRPILDFMQTMPAFVYLIPAVLFFDWVLCRELSLPSSFAMPPVVRLTGLGIRQVPKNGRGFPFFFWCHPLAVAL